MNHKAHAHGLSIALERCLRKLPRALLVVGLVVVVAACPVMCENATASTPHAYPRLMSMQIGEPDYHLPQNQSMLGRFDIVVLGFYPGWQRLPSASPVRDATAEIQSRNRDMLIGQYTVMNESRDEGHKWAATEADRIKKLNEMNWWLRDARGRKVQWTSQYGNWDVNFTRWTTADADGRRFPQWIANRDYGRFFRDVPDFRIWYVDNVMNKPRVRADWNIDGIDDNPDEPRVQQAFRAGYVSLWDEIRRIHPKAMIMVNTDGDLSESEYRSKVEAAFLEGLMGKEWSIERRLGWTGMMRHYRSVKSNLRHPALIGFNVWGDRHDFRFFRYAFTSCLLDDGFFSFTDVTAGYTGVVWFDEYDFKLGEAQTPPPASAWQNGVWRRDFQNGVVLINPGDKAASVVLERPLKRLDGKQDRSVNNGTTTSRVTIAPRDGLLLQRFP